MKDYRPAKKRVEVTVGQVGKLHVKKLFNKALQQTVNQRGRPVLAMVGVLAGLIDQAFLLMSYSPPQNRYPYIRSAIERAT